MQGPQRGSSQEIGDDAVSALNARRPSRWHIGEIGGTDFGFDFQVTVFGPDDEGAKLYFNLQLKGTTQKNSRLADGLHLSHSFDRSTLNLWHSSFTGVLVAIVDMIDGRDPLQSTVHYEFVSPHLDDLLLGLPPKQASVTIRVSRKNCISRDLDILPAITPYLDELRDARRQVRDRKWGDAAPSTPLGLVPTDRSPSQFASVGTSGEAEELEAVIEGLRDVDVFREALQALKAGNAGRVIELTSRALEADRSESPLDTAVYAYLRARALILTGESDDSGHLLEIAHAAMPDNDNVVAALAQHRLENIPFDAAGQNTRTELLQWLERYQGPLVKAVMAKVYALDGRFDEARHLLKAVPKSKAAVVSVIVSIIEGDWSRAIEECCGFRQEVVLTQPQELSLTVMEARAYFQLAFQNVQTEERADKTIPAAGLPGMDIERIKVAFEIGLKAIHLAQVLRWPAVTEHLLDVLPISAAILDRLDEAFPVLAILGQARPRNPVIREAVVRVALNAGQPEMALRVSDLAADAPKFSNEDALLAVAACRAGNVAKAFSFVDSQGSDEVIDEEILLSTLMTIGVAADSAMRTETLEKVRRKLQTTRNGKDFLAILDSAIAVRQSVLVRQEAVSELYEYWLANGQPNSVGRHLLMNADPANHAEAAIVCKIVEIGSFALDSEQQATYGESLITLERYDEAIESIGAARLHFDRDPRFASLQAIALELSGNSPEAFAMFEALIESGEVSETARRYFINSAARFGFVEKAEAQVRNALSIATNSKARLRHLNTLFQLGLLSSLPGSRLWELAWEYGRLADPEDEREEGFFLQEAIAALMSFTPEADDARVREYSSRRDLYCERFPASPYLRRADVDARKEGLALVQALQEATGKTDEQLRLEVFVERQMDAGAIPVPFSWRPREYLRNVPDAIALWQLRRTKPIERRAWHIESNAESFNRGCPSDLSGWEPVLSLTSLLLLDECNLLDAVLRAFSRVVVARATLIELQNVNNPVTAGLGREQALRILATLRASFSKVIHPPYSALSDKYRAHAWHAEEVVAMAVPGRIYFCDDVIESAQVCGEDQAGIALKPSICTVDFLRWADQVAGIFSPYEVAKSIAQIIKAKIGVLVDARYLVASIPHSLQMSKSRAEATFAFESAEAQALRTILDGIWVHEKPFTEMLRHFSLVMAYLVTHGQASEQVLESLWLRWLQAVRHQNTDVGTPIGKLASSFVGILLHVDKTADIARIWHVFWSVIESGVPDAIEESPDVTGVSIVASTLGTTSAMGKSLLSASDISQRARSGLNPGTALHERYNEEYVQAAARRASIDATSRKG